MTETVSSQITIDAPQARVLEVLTDFEEYPKWARSIKIATVLDRDDSGRASSVEFHVAPGMLPEITYTLRYKYADDTLSWDYVEGSLRDISGYYKVEPENGGTLVSYHLAIDPRPLPLPGFVKARAAREITRIALKELKRRVES